MVAGLLTVFSRGESSILFIKGFRVICRLGLFVRVRRLNPKVSHCQKKLLVMVMVCSMRVQRMVVRISRSLPRLSCQTGQCGVARHLATTTFMSWAERKTN